MIQFSLIHNNLSLQNKCIRYTAELIHVIYTKYSNRRPKLRLPQPLAPPTTGDITVTSPELLTVSIHEFSPGFVHILINDV